MNPFDEIKKFSGEMDNIFKRFFKPDKNSKGLFSGIKQNNKDLIIEINLLGVNEKDIILQFTDNSIEIRAKKQSEIKISKKNYSRNEKGFSGFYRKFALPANIDVEEAKSEFKNGILKITIPKKESKKILIK